MNVSTSRACEVRTGMVPYMVAIDGCTSVRAARLLAAAPAKLIGKKRAILSNQEE